MALVVRTCENRPTLGSCVRHGIHEARSWKADHSLCWRRIWMYTYLGGTPLETRIYKHAASSTNWTVSIDPTLCDKVRITHSHGEAVTWQSWNPIPCWLWKMVSQLQSMSRKCPHPGPFTGIGRIVSSNPAPGRYIRRWISTSFTGE